MRRSYSLLLLAAFVFAFLFTTPQATVADSVKVDKIAHLDMSKFLDCLDNKESSNRTDHRDGDNGQSIGFFQIKESYWKDAVEFDKSIGGTYQDVRKPEYAMKVITAYMRRYAPANATYKDLALIHQGGPKGHLRNSKTAKEYWEHRAFDPLR
jgi:Destabilase